MSRARDVTIPPPFPAACESRPRLWGFSDPQLARHVDSVSPASDLASDGE